MAIASVSVISATGNEETNTTINETLLPLPSSVASEISIAAAANEESNNNTTTTSAAEPVPRPSSSVSSDSSITATNEDTNNNNNIAAEPAPQPASTGKRKGRSRIYDPENGKTCHQCRQKTRNLVVACKKPRSGDKTCSLAPSEETCPLSPSQETCPLNLSPKTCLLNYCHKCLLDRYGEKSEEVEELEDWVCPKCRSICNCSCCLIRKGRNPTGQLTKIAKKQGFASVHHLLIHVESVAAESGIGIDDVISLLKSSPASNKGSVDPNASDKENRHDGKKSSSRKNKRGSGNVDAEARQPKVCKQKQQAVNNAERAEDNLSAEALPSPKVRKLRKHIIAKPIEPNVALPQGTSLRTIAGVEFQEDDVGEALQFLEFCNTFEQVLGINEGEAESLLQELARGHIEEDRGCKKLPRKRIPLIVRFHKKLLSIIRDDMREEPLSCLPRLGNSWLQGLEKYVRFSQCALKELLLDCPVRGPLKYDDFKQSTKLKLLNLLCDEILCTEKIRTWIDNEHSEFHQRKRKFKQQAQAAHKRATDTKQKLKDEYDAAKLMLSSRDGAPLSVSEHDNFISKLKSEAEEAKADMESINLLCKKEQTMLFPWPSAPILLEGSGHAYWKLRSYCNSSNILLQDIKNGELTTIQDKWFVFDEEDEKIIGKHVSTSRDQRHRTKAIKQHNIHDGNESEDGRIDEA